MRKFAEFLSSYDNQSTRGGYSAAIYTFMDFVYGKQRESSRITDNEKEKYEDLIEKYLTEKHDYRDDLMKFASSLQHRPPLSARQTFNSVREFLSYNDIEVKLQDLKRIRNRLPKGGVRTEEGDLDLDTIRSVLQHMDVKGRALVLVLASSGMRLGEALQVTLDDVKLHTKPASITIRGENTKTGNLRFTFISSEAVQAVNEWLKIRDDYLKASQNKNAGFVTSGNAKQKSSDDNRLFPFSDQNASQMWDGALRKAGFLSRDKTTNRKQLHYHMFRKFFISQLALIVSKEIPEALAGHSGYLTGAYRRYTKKELAEHYLKGEHLLTITTPKELVEIQSEFKAEMETQAKRVLYVIDDNNKLREELTHLQKEIATSNEIFQSVMNDPDILQKLKEAMNLVRTLDNNLELKKKVARSRGA